jgi:hypothetical protein
MGSGAAPVGWPVGATGKARLPRPFIMRAYGGGGFGSHVVCRVQRGKKKNCLPLLHVQGKEKGEQCRSKRHCSALFFFKYETASFRIKHVVSFKKKGAKTRQFPNQPLIIFCLFQLHPFQFHSHPHFWPPFPLWSLVSDLCNLTLN